MDAHIIVIEDALYLSKTVTNILVKKYPNLQHSGYILDLVTEQYASKSNLERVAKIFGLHHMFIGAEDAARLDLQLVSLISSIRSDMV